MPASAASQDRQEFLAPWDLWAKKERKACLDMLDQEAKMDSAVYQGQSVSKVIGVLMDSQDYLACLAARVIRDSQGAKESREVLALLDHLEVDHCLTGLPENRASPAEMENLGNPGLMATPELLDPKDQKGLLAEEVFLDYKATKDCQE